ncbi:hypothetical protein Acor_23230 [Acrocarpospora corrugata]|uniref:Secreted protein n=1 Tax=Acrocarpospora corrugata TaxID=35763 RepID=A0A5M3VWC2_9ACTN|nr:hypothetical protein [Acrocarpospora corrugata]GES00260.1 hypothetical protein Acor_23230 [Acrocarpospora corrugata]
MKNAWDEIRSAIDAGAGAAVADLITALDEEQRRAVARELPGHLAAVRAEWQRRQADWEAGQHARWAELDREAERLGVHMQAVPGAAAALAWTVPSPWTAPLRLAGAGTLPGAAAAVSWLGKRDFEPDWEHDPIDETSLIAQAVAARPVAWQQDVAVRLALRLRATRPEADRQVRLVLTLLRASGAEPPEHDPLTLAWVVAAAPSDLAGDPLLDSMVPRLFESEGVGRLLRGSTEWPAALGALAVAGRVKRETLLDGCRTRFLRGGQAADQRFFVRLHDLLGPSQEEAAPHLRDYLAMLPAAPANVAELALKQVRRAGPVEPGPAGEAAEGLIFRTEGKLVQAGLAWLDRLLKDSGGDLDAYAPALAAALLCESAGARERAVQLAVKHAGRFTPLGAELLREAVETLPAHQGAALASIFGGEVAAEPEAEPFVRVPLPAVPEPAPFPPLVREPEELARFWPSYDNWRRSELWLDGFVRMAALDRDRLAAALAPATTQRPRTAGAHWALNLATALVGPDSHPPYAMTSGGAGELMPSARQAEVYDALEAGLLPPYLLSTPTRATGLIDADALVERVAGYEQAGVTALPQDLRQASLRAGGAVGAETAERAARLTSPAGRQVARWLIDRPTAPEVTLIWTSHENDPRIDFRVGSGPEYRELIGELLAPRLREEPCEPALAVFAGHRELAAARWVYALESTWPLGTPTLAHLELLVCADGPAGPATALLLAHFLQAGPHGGAVPSLLRLAATGALPGVEVGTQLAALLKRRAKAPVEAVEALRAAAEQGAHREVWQVLTGLLTAYLPGPGERATTVHTRLVSFAADAAGWAGARGEVPVIAALAARTTSSELVRQARRLHTYLTTPYVEE